MAARPLTAQLTPFRRGAFVRVFTGCWLVLQATVAAAVPLVDAQADHSDRVVAHWEDGSDTTCPPLHDISGCQLCQQITGAGRAASVRNLVPDSEQELDAPRMAAQARVPRPEVVGSLTARAPPVR